MFSLAPKPRESGSTDFNLLFVPRVETHAGTRAFSVALPTVKSSNNIVSLRHHLKTHLFRLAYPS